MDLEYGIRDFEYTINSMNEFLSYDKERYIDSLIYFYKDLNRDTILCNSKFEDGIKRLIDINKDIFVDKERIYQEYWDKNRRAIEGEFENIFRIDLKDKFNNMKAYVCLNPIMPRYLSNKSFDVFYLNSEKGAMGSSLHEIVHFIWFDVWQDHFKDHVSEYETPHLKWIFSEMVVDPILTNSNILDSLNPYKKPSYESFYKVDIDGKPLMEIINTMYLEKKSMVDFMEEGYKFCLDNSKYIEDIR